jgi:hypothetical protein
MYPCTFQNAPDLNLMEINFHEIYFAAPAHKYERTLYDNLLCVTL